MFQENICPVSQKRCYDKKGAQTVANIRKKVTGRNMRIYQCPECDQWHLTKRI